MINDPQRGRGRAHVTNFCMRNYGLIFYFTMAGRSSLSEINNAVDGGPLFLAPTTVDANYSIH